MSVLTRQTVKYLVTYIYGTKIINLKASSLSRALRYKHILKSMGFDSLIVKQ